MAKEIKDLRAEVENLRSVIKQLVIGDAIDTGKIKIFPDVPKIIGPMNILLRWQATILSKAILMENSREIEL